MAQLFSTLLTIRNVPWAAEQHIRMISDGSCDTEDWSNDAEMLSHLSGQTASVYFTSVWMLCPLTCWVWTRHLCVCSVPWRPRVPKWKLSMRSSTRPVTASRTWSVSTWAERSPKVNLKQRRCWKWARLWLQWASSSWTQTASQRSAHPPTAQSTSWARTTLRPCGWSRKGKRRCGGCWRVFVRWQVWLCWCGRDVGTIASWSCGGSRRTWGGSLNWWAQENEERRRRMAWMCRRTCAWYAWVTHEVACCWTVDTCAAVSAAIRPCRSPSVPSAGRTLNVSYLCIRLKRHGLISYKWRVVLHLQELLLEIAWNFKTMFTVNRTPAIVATHRYLINTLVFYHFGFPYSYGSLFLPPE